MIVSCKQRGYDHLPEAIFWAEIAHKCVDGRGSATDSAGGAYSTPPDP